MPQKSNDDNSSVFRSPWLRPKQAAAYCKMSLSLFNQKRKVVPINKIGGSKRGPKYNFNDLDTWMVKLYAFETNETQLAGKYDRDNLGSIERFPLKTTKKKHRPRLLD